MVDIAEGSALEGMDAVYGSAGMTDTIVVGGIRCSRADRADMVAQMVADSQSNRRGDMAVPRIVAAVNGHVVSEYHRDRTFRARIDGADILDVDGMPLVLATRLLCRRPLRERVATTDLILDSCKAAAEKGLRFYFLGGQPGVAAAAAQTLEQQFPGLKIAGVRHGYFSPADEADVCKEVIAAGTDILWLGLGSPLQDDFAYRNRQNLAGIAWIRTCGGLFDYYSGRAPRAPGWLQLIGFEWLYRAMQEPRRLGMRYLTTNPPAIYHILTKTHD